jgi:hypothetical protein
MVGEFRPNAVLCGLSVQIVLAVEASVLAAGAIAAVSALPGAEEVFASQATLLFVLGKASPVCIGLAAGAVTGLAAGRRETLHAALLLMVAVALQAILASATGARSILHAFRTDVWHDHLYFPAALLGGFLVQLLRVARVKREVGGPGSSGA